MFCPYCHGEDTKVVDKRDNSDTGVTRRRRECISCQKRFTTYERVESITLNVEKRSGKIVDFDRAKLRNSIQRAIKKQQVSDEEVEELIDDIELKLLNRKKTVVKSTDIGNMVLTRLRKLDKLSYLRFVSVYKDFDSIEKFKEELFDLEKTE